MTAKAAKGLNKSTKRRVDWYERRGVIVSVNAYSVFIAWEGNKSTDQMPIKAVERCG